MATRWQQLGAFVDNIDDVSAEQLERFADASGKWVIPLLSQLGYPDDHDSSCVNNMALLENFKERCAPYKINVGGWFNGWNGGELNWSADEQAAKVESIVKPHNLGPIVLDLESAYKGDPHALPALLWAMRQRFKTREIAISTNEPNDSIPYNGYQHHQASYKGSMRRLGIKLLPQWYNSPNYGGMWMQPDQTMEWIQANGMKGNWLDSSYANKRAIPMSFIHGTLEVTDLEGATLAGELQALMRAKQFGYSVGLSLYLLEKMPPSDFDLIKQYRGTLYYV